MISGKINSLREAVITVFVLDSASDRQPVEAVIDTGFTGSLTMPPKFVEDLGLRFIGQRLAVLADGNRVSLRSYEATIDWHEGFRAITVIEADGSPLVGMKLLEGSLVTLHVKDGGAVNIEPES